MFAKPYLHAIHKFFTFNFKYVWLFNIFFFKFSVLPKKILTWKHNLYLMFNLHKLIFWFCIFSQKQQKKNTTENHWTGFLMNFKHGHNCCFFFSLYFFDTYFLSYVLTFIFHLYFIFYFMTFGNNLNFLLLSKTENTSKSNRKLWLAKLSTKK